MSYFRKFNNKQLPPNDWEVVLVPKVGVLVLFPNKPPAVEFVDLVLKRELLFPKTGGVLVPKLGLAMVLLNDDCPKGLLCCCVLKPIINNKF